MFLRRCRLLIKRIYNSFAMFKEDQIATAQIAQIFGSELLKVQNAAQTDSGHTPNIVNLNPKSFLVGEEKFSNQRKAEEQRLIQMLQREAEAACPLPPEQTYTPQTAPATIPSQVTTHVQPIIPKPRPEEHTSAPSPSLSLSESSCLLVLERIALSLERIANAVDKVEIKSKKKIVKRNNKPKINKPILLNETTA